jgi:hypothetical protein
MMNRTFEGTHVSHGGKPVIPMHRFDPTILREYDIRGIVGQTLAARDAYAVGRAFGTVVRRGGGRAVCVGYDGRLTSPELESALVEGLRACGLTAWRIGLGPTPMLYYATTTLMADAGIMVTGSHNPPEHNGFKMMLGRAAFYGPAIQELGRIAVQEVIERTGIDPEAIDEVVMGNIAQPPEATNIARVIALKSGIPRRVPAVTVARNCASGMEAIANAHLKIASGMAEVILAGGLTADNVEAVIAIGSPPPVAGNLAVQAETGNVQWLQYCTDSLELAKIYRAADLFVHPGVQETFGLVAIESQSCGTPVVGIRGSRMDKVILHEQDLWAAENTPEALAKHLFHEGMHMQLFMDRAAARQARWPRPAGRLRHSLRCDRLDAGERGLFERPVRPPEQ